MRKLLYIILACVALALTGRTAHAASLRLGLCEGQLATTGVSKTGSGTIQVAIMLPAQEFQQYAGATITGMRLGLMLTDGITDVQGFVRTSLEGDNLAIASVASPVVGWNEVLFDANPALELSEGQDLVIGYQFVQSKSVKCISLAGRTTADSYWVAKNGEWDNRSDKAEGSVSVELIIDGPMVPAVNLAIEQVTYPKIVRLGDDLEAQVVVRNMAMTPVCGYTCNYQAEKWVTVLDEVDRTHVTLDYLQRDTCLIRVRAEQLDADDVLNPMSVYVLDAACLDEVEADNRAVIYRTVYADSVPHLTLLEEFTTEECGNCPRAINTFAQMTAEGYRYAQISHHVGYYTDFLTVDEDKANLWFYGTEGSFAPAGMLDRTADPDYHTVNGFTGVPVFSVGYADSFRPAIQKAVSQPAFVTLLPVLAYDEATRQLQVSVEVEKLPVLDALTSEARLTVVLVEDSIPAQHQAGISGTSFRHRHVYRKSITSQWGEPLEWDGLHTSLSAEYTLPEEWCAERIAAVCYVSNYNPADRCDCQVFNTAVAEVSQISAIERVRQDAPSAPALCFDLMGRPVTTDVRGMIIRQGKLVAK